MFAKTTHRFRFSSIVCSFWFDLILFRVLAVRSRALGRRLVARALTNCCPSVGLVFVNAPRILLLVVLITRYEWLDG